MSDNGFWISFWIIMLIFYSIGKYSDYNIEEVKAENSVKISKIREENNKKLLLLINEIKGLK